MAGLALTAAPAATTGGAAVGATEGSTPVVGAPISQTATPINASYDTSGAAGAGAGGGGGGADTGTGTPTTPTVPAQPVYTGASAAAAVTNATNKFDGVNNQITNYNAAQSATAAQTDASTAGAAQTNSSSSGGGGSQISPDNAAALNAQGVNTQTPQTTSAGTTSIPTPPDLSHIQIQAQDQQQIDSLTAMQATMDQSSQNLIQALTNAFDVRIQAQQLQNTMTLAGATTQNIAMGVDRYAPTVAASIFTSQEAANNRALADLESQKYQALVQAQQAQAQMDFSALDKIHGEYVDAENRQKDLLQSQYDNVIKQNQAIIANQQNQRDQRNSDLQYNTQTAENFAPAVLKQLNSLPDQGSKDAFIQSFATSHNIDAATLNGVVAKYNDTINQSMKTAMYQMLAENPSAGISMDDINNNNISAVAQKVMGGYDYKLKTEGEQADISQKFAEAALTQSKVSAMQDPNSIQAYAQQYLSNGTLPQGDFAAMGPAVIDAAKMIVAEKAPAGAPLSVTTGLPAQNLSQDTSNAITGNTDVLQRIENVRNLLATSPTFPGASTATKVGQLVGVTDPNYTKLQAAFQQIATSYQKAQGGSRDVASPTLMKAAQDIIGNPNNFTKYNLSLLDQFEQNTVSDLKTVLNTNGITLNRTPVMTGADKEKAIIAYTAQGQKAGMSALDITQELYARGLINSLTPQ